MDSKQCCPAHPYAGFELKDNWRAVCPKCGTFLWWAAPPGLLQKPECKRCNSLTVVKLYRVKAANGHDHYVWHCNSCQRHVKDGQRLFLPIKMVSEFMAYWSARLPERNLPRTIDELPLLKDNTGNEPCAICGDTATEYNHFMPQVFKDDPDVADEWTEWDRMGAWLCNHHHRLWHAKVAPLQVLSQIKRKVAA